MAYEHPTETRRAALRDEIIRCAMAYVFGDYPNTDDLPTRGDALAALERACMEMGRPFPRASNEEDDGA